MDELLSLYTPQTLTHAVNKIKPENLYLTKTLDKKAPIFSPTETVMFDVTEGRRDLAPMGHPGDPAVRVDMAETFKTYSVTAPQIFMEDPVKAADVAGRRMAGQSPITVGTNANPVLSAFNQYVAQKQKNMVDSIARRIEWMWVQLITTGKIDYTGPNGRRFKVEYGWNTNLCNLTASAPWDGAAANQGDPLLQLQQWRRDYATMNGFNPSVWILGTAAADAFKANANVKAWLRSPAVQYMQANIGNNADLVTPVANIPGVGQLVEHSAVLPNDIRAGVSAAIPENVLIITSPEVFQMHYGAIYDFDLPGSPLAMVPRFSKMKDAHDGKTKSLFVESHPLPVMLYDTGVMVIDVMAPPATGN